MKSTLPAVAVVVALLGVLFSAGCTVNRPHFTETTTGTNGVITTRTLSVPTFAVWPATTALDKQRASLGKTFTLGTEGLREDGGGTNVVEALRALDSILGRVK